MAPTQNGLTAGNSQPVKNTFKQGTDSTSTSGRATVSAAAPAHSTTLVARFGSSAGGEVDHQVSAIIRPGATNTIKAADLPDSEAFSCPEFMVLDVGRAYPQGWPHRFGGVFKPHVHSSDLSSQRVVFEIPVGIKTMKPTKPGALPATTHAHHTATLILRAQNHLAGALFQLRNASGNVGLKMATGRAIAAARALKQLSGDAHHE